MWCVLSHQVYSRSQGQWLPGIVIGIEGIEAKVTYKSQGQIGEKWVYWADENEMKVVGAAAGVTTVTIELTKGPAGYGMAITSNCHVTDYAGADSVARLANVPLQSKIIQVGGKAVSTKADIGAAIKVRAAPTAAERTHAVDLKAWSAAGWPDSQGCCCAQGVAVGQPVPFVFMVQSKAAPAAAPIAVAPMASSPSAVQPIEMEMLEEDV